MKRTVLVSGLISGIILSLWMIGFVGYCYTHKNFEGSMLLGYTAMLVGLSLVFVGVKNYRDNYNSGFISFGKALQIGLLISLIASTMYVIAWMISYYVFLPDFMDRYAAHSIERMRAKGASAAEIKAGIAQINQMKEMYKSPVWVVLFTYAEIVPVALLVSLIAALILKRKQRNNTLATA
ncbi:DUF4199 domain-containing protein [Mucilaginibacter sp. RS28]|uniref:DUF4199 domain-containing protein n=1 Tax=Mucilaginibacter straminoryzae TaxID=2932774 RepID=A0A9X2BBI4_9SPHI|nr:DUF4199 domain-containing protein [Mucilaginibacter straminoryzae]MCJ8208308.1 DUF4199 domain-containing protein [Mucilaginibacter straminoryzae]